MTTDDPRIAALEKRATIAEAEAARLTPWVSKLQASVITETARAERVEKAAKATLAYYNKLDRLYEPGEEAVLDALDAALSAVRFAVVPSEAPASAEAEAEPVTGPSPVGSASSLAREIERLADQSRSLASLIEALKTTATHIMSGPLPSVEANGGGGRD